MPQSPLWGMLALCSTREDQRRWSVPVIETRVKVLLHASDLIDVRPRIGSLIAAGHPVHQLGELTQHNL